MHENDQTLEVEIERILPGGLGLAHAEGLTLFVALAAPGDRVRVRVDRVKRKIGFASIVEVLRPSSHRVEPPCPYFGRCGGCDFQQLNYQSQLDAKVEIIRDCLHRIARVAEPPSIQIVPSPLEWQYRSRTNWQFDPQRKHLGYFEGGSHRVCDVEVCAVLAPELQAALEALRAEMREGNSDEMPREIDAVVGDVEISVNPAAAGFRPQVVRRQIGDEEYEFDATSFFQINHGLLADIVTAACEESSLTRSSQTAVDLYCGAGLFTIPLARKFAQVVGVEANSNAVSFARKNLARAGLTNAEIVNERVGDWLRVNAAPGEGAAVDFLLLDPPRTGVEPSAIDGIVALEPVEISYVSCDPATLGRDLRELLVRGYALEKVTAFDMFPQTHHVETIVRLVNRGR